MLPPIENPTDREVRAVIQFLCVQCFKSIDIHHQISEVEDENIMSDGMLRKLVRPLKMAAQTFMMRNQVVITDSKSGRYSERQQTIHDFVLS